MFILWPNKKIFWNPEYEYGNENGKNKVCMLLSFKKGTKTDFDLYLKTLILLVIGGHEKIIFGTTVRVDEKAMRNRSGIH